MVKNLPSNAGNTGLIPGWETKIPHAAGQLSLLAAATEPVHSGAREPRLESVHNNEGLTQPNKLTFFFLKKRKLPRSSSADTLEEGQQWTWI